MSPGKLTASINLASVLIRVTVAPVKSLPTVVLFTVNKIDVIVPRALLKVNVGRGSCPFLKAKPSAFTGNL